MCAPFSFSLTLYVVKGFLYYTQYRVTDACLSRCDTADLHVKQLLHLEAEITRPGGASLLFFGFMVQRNRKVGEDRLYGENALQKCSRDAKDVHV